MKGRKSSDTINTLLKDLHAIRGTEMSKLFCKKNQDICCFDDASRVESQSKKTDSSLFGVGSTQKKRPNNLVLGRIYDGHILDMFEFGIEQYKKISEFKSNATITPDMKPFIIFQGEPFEMNTVYARLKNLLIDFFKLSEVSELNIAELARVIVVTC